MMKSGHVKMGQIAHFEIGQDTLERNKNVPMYMVFNQKLEANKLLTAFEKLALSRQKEVNRYLNHLKSEEALSKNMDKMINVLKGKATSPLLRLK